MSNAHLPATLGWMSYQFKLWLGLRYGIATLATPLAAANTVLEGLEYRMLSFLGVNRNINRGWQTLPRAFGGVGLFIFAVEHMIVWAGMLLLHCGVPSLMG